jgi:Ca-activated chloride channel homolog
VRLAAIAETDRTLIRAGASSTRYVRFCFTAPALTQDRRRLPLNVSLVLDRSGSMAGDKFELARQAAHKALQLLGADDRFSLVVYDTEIDIVTGSTHATADARRIARDRLAEVEPRGSTNLCGGWLRGCEQVGQGLTRDTIGRCLLLTDGLANVGITDGEQLRHHARELRSRGVATSTFGIGADFDERLLQGMADASGGHFYYLQRAAQIPDLLASEMGEALEVVARDSTLDVRAPDGVTVEPVNRLQVHRDDATTSIVLDDLVSGQEIEVVLAFTFPSGREGHRQEVTLSLGDRDGALEPSEHTVVWTYASHDENDRQPRNVAVDRAVAAQYAGRARTEALDRNREGDLEGARQALQATANRIRGYAHGDRELVGLVRELDRQSDEYAARPLSSPERKAAAFANYVVGMSRSAAGRARKAGAGQP